MKPYFQPSSMHCRPIGAFSILIVKGTICNIDTEHLKWVLLSKFTIWEGVVFSRFFLLKANLHQSRLRHVFQSAVRRPTQRQNSIQTSALMQHSTPSHGRPKLNFMLHFYFQAFLKRLDTREVTCGKYCDMANIFRGTARFAEAPLVRPLNVQKNSHQSDSSLFRISLF